MSLLLSKTLSLFRRLLRLKSRTEDFQGFLKKVTLLTMCFQKCVYTPIPHNIPHRRGYVCRTVSIMSLYIINIIIYRYNPYFLKLSLIRRFQTDSKTDSHQTVTTVTFPNASSPRPVHPRAHHTTAQGRPMQKIIISKTQPDTRT